MNNNVRNVLGKMRGGGKRNKYRTRVGELEHKDQFC